MQTNSSKLFRNFVIFFSPPEESFKSLKSTYVKKTRDNKYDENIKEIATISTINDFWFYYSHMVRPKDLPNKTSFSFFQVGVKPMWEDSGNLNGGRFMLRVKKEYANKFWEDLLLNFVGDTCEENDSICGIQLTIKDKEIVIAIWVRACSSLRKECIKDWILKNLNLDESAEIEFRNHPENRSQYKDGKRFNNNNNRKYEEKRGVQIQYKEKKMEENEKK